MHCQVLYIKINYIKILFILFFLLTSTKCFSYESQAKACVLLNGHSQKIIYGKNQDEFVFPASTTKIVTALYVLRNFSDSLNEVAIAKKSALQMITPQAKKESNYRSPGYWLETDGIMLGIKVGEELVIKDLLTSLLICSPNDAANVLADHLGGNIEQFMSNLRLMVNELGLKKSNFINPHGLHHPMHRTTAFEMGILACEALKFPLFREIIQMSTFHFPQTNLEYERLVVQTNRLIRSNNYLYPYCIGGKTGTTTAAGKCLIAIAEKEGRVLVVCLFGCETREALYGDCIRLFEEAFKEKQVAKKILSEGSHFITLEILKKKKKVKAYLKEPVIYRYFPSEKEKMNLSISFDEKKLPIGKGKQLGELVIENEKQTIRQKYPIYAEEKIGYTLMQQLFRFFSYKKLLLPIAIFLLLIPLRRKF